MKTVHAAACRPILFFFCSLALLCLAACGKEQPEAGTADGVAQFIALAPQNADAVLTPPPIRETSYVIGVHAAVQDDGDWRIYRFDSPRQVRIVPFAPDGLCFDHWEVDGVRTDAGSADGLLLDVTATSVVEAVLRPVKRITTRNAVMQHVNEKRLPRGDTFTELLFEQDYWALDSVKPGGTATVFVKAVIPHDMQLDHWRVNGMPFFCSNEMISFTVVELDTAMQYEAVLVKKGTPATVPGQGTETRAAAAPGTPLFGSVHDSAGYERYAAGVGCTLNGGARTVTLDGPTQITAVAAPAGGEVFDHWEIDGVRTEAAPDGSCTFTAEQVTAVRAVMRPQRRIDTVGATMRFIDQNGTPAGDAFVSLLYDEPYPTLTGTAPGGTVTLQVRSNAVEGKNVDGWRVNGVWYFPKHRIARFVLQNLDKSLEFEPSYYVPSK